MLPTDPTNPNAQEADHTHDHEIKTTAHEHLKAKFISYNIS